MLTCLTAIWMLSSLPSLPGGDIEVSERNAFSNGTVLVFRPSSKPFEQAHDSMINALEDGFNVEKVLVDGNTDVAVFDDAIRIKQPKMLVIMNNTTVRLYRRWQKTQPEGTQFPPSLIMMTLYGAQNIKGIQNALCLTYEVPGLIALNHMRNLVSQPVRRVGVVYSAELAPFFEYQKELSGVERIDLVGIPISREQARPGDIRRALRQLLNQEKVDAIWIFNDSVLLSQKNLKRAWTPILVKCKKPILVGVRNLMELGLLGVFPDHQGLGEQAASIIFDLHENEWKWTGNRIRNPIRVIKTVNKARATPARIELRASALDEMDHIID